jgi:ribonucleoside-diphosphate reductase alpha chain
MGLADFLIKMGIKYDTQEGLDASEKLMEFINDEGHKMSSELGEEKGSFPNFRGSIWDKDWTTMRNATVTTIAPTGTISIIAGCSQGIEPLFAVTYVREVAESLGRSLVEVNALFETMALREGFYSEELMKKISRRTSIQDLEEIPQHIRTLFVTAHDITAEWHVRMQATFQKYTDNAVSKTINFPRWATPDDIEKAFSLAYKLGCKGITVYRHGSREVQVLRPIESEGTVADYSLTCPTCA